MKCSTYSCGPFELKISDEGGFDLERLFGFDVQQNDGARLAHWDEERFSNREIVARVDECCGFRVDDQRADQAFGCHGATVYVKGQMKAPEDFQRIDPGFHLSAFVAEQAGAHADYGKEFPRANRAREFERWRRLLGRNGKRREEQKAQKKRANCSGEPTTNIAKVF